ncbi:hypothetical protein BDV93DRAFT_606542 [Ceratobasidium sp. AG-I]|nr:hypothetical protein BDV93DRAFT_606542 [Ceratobasidium sp. AG-I]
MTLAQRFSLQDNDLGKTLARLFVTSLVVSLVSVVLNLTYYGFTSYFVIPSAFVVTVLHHTILWRRLVKYKKNTPTPLCDTPPCLKHAGNIWTLLLFSLTWTAGGALPITFASMFINQYWYHNEMVTAALGMASGILAIAEGALLMTIMALCYRALTREGYAGAICTRAHTDAEDAESTVFEKN